MREGESEGDLIGRRCRLRKSVKTAITKTEGPDSETEKRGGSLRARIRRSISARISTPRADKKYVVMHNSK